MFALHIDNFTILADTSPTKHIGLNMLLIQRIGFDFKLRPM